MDLPSGTVTLLFTDIEGSTRLLREVGVRYAELLAEHRRQLRAAISRHDGYELDAHGDCFFAAFANASQALAAAQAIQRSRADGLIRVRVGLHTGEPLLTDEGYVGIDVHKAARVASAGRGGQILLSEETRELLDRGLAARDLGPHRLKDLGEPIRLYQLGDGDFPPLRSLNATNLPIPPTPLVGRERELREARELLRTHRVVTLTGAGGSGKTRLALELAADVVGDFPDGVVWVPLQALQDPDVVLSTIARAMGAGETLLDEVGDRRVLLALDNFEQLLAAASDVGDLVGRATHLKMLVTSREPLHIGAEHEYPVAPLREREAVQLFVARATAAKPDFRDDGAVLEICRRLDCLPLALELAAALVKALTPGELLQRLDRRLPILTGGPRDAPERQRTLRATIAWSYDLLTPEEQRVFARLAVFTGGCTIRAAEQVCEARLDTVAALIDKSLLRREGDRYSMLETIGEYARERLDESGELDELRQRHAEYYLEQARSIQSLVRSPQAAVHLDRIEPDQGNLRAALGSLTGGPADGTLRLVVWGLAARLHGSGDVALDRRDAGDAARLYRESLEIGLQLKDELQIAYCLAGLAAADAQRDRLRRAARLWGGVNAFERRAGGPLNETERQRYERLLGDLEGGASTSSDFEQGTAMTLEEAVAYALAEVD